ncbi:MAG: hypothetical protein O3A00_02215 [Planctomycetota bacterium]|nr:hypothetical protein [Planctomycetota bacterium]
MSSNGNIEQRLALLEKEVAKLKSRAHGDAGSWVDSIAGSMKDVPEEDFREFVRLGKEARIAQTDPQE